MQGRLDWLDTLRVVAGLWMVGLHASSDDLGRPWVEFAVDDRWAPLIVRALLYTARTELFLILSLFLLMLTLDRRARPYGETMTRQAERLLAPFLAWTVIYAGFNFVKADAFGYAPQYLDKLSDTMTWAEFFLLGSSKYHMHFLPTLFVLVAAFPLYRVARDVPLLGLLLIGALAVKWQLDTFLWRYMSDWAYFEFVLRLVKLSTYLAYGLVGASFYGLWLRYPDQLRGFLPVLLWIGAGLLAIKFGGIWLAGTNGAWPYSWAPGYWADFLMPAVMFAACMALGQSASAGWIKAIAPYSFGIYLAHPVFLDVIEIQLKDSQMLPIWQMGIKTAFALVMAVILAKLLERSRYTAWIVGVGAVPWRRETPVSSTPAGGAQ
ncbi:MAG: acyltransferase family protein [Shimia sp.]